VKFHPLANLSSWIESNRAPDPAAAAATAPEPAPDDAASGALDADELARLQAMADEFWADDEEVEL